MHVHLRADAFVLVWAHTNAYVHICLHACAHHTCSVCVCCVGGMCCVLAHRQDLEPQLRRQRPVQQTRATEPGQRQARKLVSCVRTCMLACMLVGARLRACISKPAHPPACLPACIHACACACVHACVRVRARVRACVPANMCSWMRACVCRGRSSGCLYIKCR